MIPSFATINCRSVPLRGEGAWHNAIVPPTKNGPALLAPFWTIRYLPLWHVGGDVTSLTF